MLFGDGYLADRKLTLRSTLCSTPSPTQDHPLHFFGTPPFLADHDTSGWFGFIRFTAFGFGAAAEVVFSLGERLLFLLDDRDEFGLPPFTDEFEGCFGDLPCCWCCCC